MSGTDFDLNAMGLAEQGAVKQIFTAPDGIDYAIEKERAILRKFDGDWTAEQMENGEAEAAGALAEVIVTENGQIVERWIRGESEHGPPTG